MRRSVLVLLLVVALGCSSNEASSPSSSGPPGGEVAVTVDSRLGPACDDVLPDGILVSEEVWTQACVTPPNVIRITGTFTCRDGRRLHAKAIAWGYEGDVVHRVAEGDPVAAQVQQDCLAPGPAPN